MKDITFLNATHKVMYSISTPFTFKLADAENIWVKGSQKWLVSLRNGSQIWLVSLRNGSQKWLVSLRNSVTETD